MRPGVCAPCCCFFLRAPPPNPAPPPRSLWQKIAGYESASDVEQHSKIDLDMDEFESIEFGIDDIVRSGLVKSYLISKLNLGI